MNLYYKHSIINRKYIHYTKTLEGFRPSDFKFETFVRLHYDCMFFFLLKLLEMKYLIFVKLEMFFEKVKRRSTF